MRSMPNIASLLKSEIARVARKEVRAGTDHLKKAASAYRSEIAALKRRCQALEQQLRNVNRGVAKAAPAATAGAAADGDADGLRFSAKGLASHRKRLGLSAHDFGLLVGASGQSIYKWEEGSARPRAKNVAAIAKVRTMGKREANARLAELR
jgi:DNA-binding transcriptional regulator YiaG